MKSRSKKALQEICVDAQVADQLLLCFEFLPKLMMLNIPIDLHWAFKKVSLFALQLGSPDHVNQGVQSIKI